METYLDQALLKLEQFEGSIPWMYRDTVGKVTTAVGLMLPDAAAAERLPFQLGGRSATAAEIAAEFARVDALPMGRPASFYRARDAEHVLELQKSEIDALLRTVLTGFEEHLRAGIPGYDALPDAVKLALLDMAYNLGPAKLLAEYTRLLHAIGQQNWQQAAGLCSRRGPGAARNEWTRQQFLSLTNVVKAVQAAAQGKQAGALKTLGFGLVGIGAEVAGAVSRWFNTPR